MSKYQIGPSKIHGKGVIALYTINKGEVIDKGIDYWLGFIPHITPDFGSWLNHSNHANTSLNYITDGYYVVATQNIRKGEEITVNYNQAPWYIDGAKPWYK